MLLLVGRNGSEGLGTGGGGASILLGESDCFECLGATLKGFDPEDLAGPQPHNRRVVCYSFGAAFFSAPVNPPSQALLVTRQGYP